MKNSLEDYILNLFTFEDSRINTFKTRYQRVDNNIDYYILKNRQTNSSKINYGIIEQINGSRGTTIIRFFF